MVEIILARFFNVGTDNELKYIISFVMTTDFASATGPLIFLCFFATATISSIMVDDAISLRSIIVKILSVCIKFAFHLCIIIISHPQNFIYNLFFFLTDIFYAFLY